MALYDKKGSKLCLRLAHEDLHKLNHHKKVHGQLFRLSGASKYACIYLLNKTNNYAFIYGCKDGHNPALPKGEGAAVLHKEAVKKAFEGNKVSYDCCKDSCSSGHYYRHTLLPLKDKAGKVSSVLGLVSILDKAAEPPQDLAVAETAGQSFVRLLINSKEEEKRKIASALHDEIGTAAVVVNSLLGILKEDIKDGKKTAALKSVKELVKAFEDSVFKIKKVIFDLRPPQLEEVGLNSAVKDLVEGLAAAVPLNFHYTYNIDEDKAKMSDTVKITLYRAVQEAINNTLKHAGAKNIKIDFSEDTSNILLKIEDDGAGFKPGAVRGKKNKLGLKGLKENLSYIGGTVKISSSRGKGTTIIVKCPKITYMR